MLHATIYKVLVPALFLLLFSASDVQAGIARPVQSPPQGVVNPDLITVSNGKIDDPIAGTISVPRSGSYKLTVNGEDPEGGQPCVSLNQGSNSVNLGKYQAGYFQLRVFENSTSIQHPACGEGTLIAADNFQIQATTTTPVTTNPNPNPALAAPAAIVRPPANPPGCAPIDTAIGVIPICDTNAFASWFVGWSIGIGSGIAFVLILLSGFKIMTSGGNPDTIKAGKEQLTSAITGLMLIIFSVFLLQLVGVEILHLPGF